MSSPTYHLFSTLEGRPNVGVWVLFQSPRQHVQQHRLAVNQPVRLGVDLVPWIASPDIVQGTPTTLSVGPYQYTYNCDGVVFATNRASSGQLWFLFATGHGYRIATDLRGNMVWTAGGPREPIKIMTFRPGDASQVFKFIKAE